MKTKHKHKLHCNTQIRKSRATKKQAHIADKAGDMHVNKLEDVGVLNTKILSLGDHPTTGRNTCTTQKHHDQSPDPRQASTETGKGEEAKEILIITH